MFGEKERRNFKLDSFQPLISFYIYVCQNVRQICLINRPTLTRFPLPKKKRERKRTDVHCTEMKLGGGLCEAHCGVSCRTHFVKPRFIFVTTREQTDSTAINKETKYRKSRSQKIKTKLFNLRYYWFMYLSKISHGKPRNNNNTAGGKAS